MGEAKNQAMKTAPKAKPSGVKRAKTTRNNKKEPGRILRYRSRPRHKDEILCHNQIWHYPNSPHGANGFRYFVCARGGSWVVCPCGWQPATGWDGPHYAERDIVAWWRKTGLKLLNGPDPFGSIPTIQVVESNSPNAMSSCVWSGKK